MARWYVTWKETVIRGTYIDADTEEAAITAGRAYVAEGGDGSFVEYVSDSDYYAEESS